MKKILSLIICVALILSIAACKPTVEDAGDVTVAVEVSEGNYEVYEIDLENVENKDNGALGVLQSLTAREENPMHLVYSDSTYGAFVTEIGSIKEDAAAGAYVMVYTSNSADSYEGAATVRYGETDLYASGVGLSSMSVDAGCVILFRLEVYSF